MLQKNKLNMVDFDLILISISGKAWSYQCMLTLIMYWNAIPFGMHTLAPVFFAAPVEYRPLIKICKVGPKKARWKMYNYVSRCNLSDISNISLPEQAEWQRDNLTCCEDGVIFLPSHFSNTVLMEFNLVCNKKILWSIATAVYMAGMWTGSILFGYISDRFGRKVAIIAAATASLVSSLCLNLSQNILTFIFIRFLIGTFCYPIFMVSFIYVMEINLKYRTVCGLLMHIPFAIGHALNSLIAFYFTRWRQFNIVISLFFAPCILLMLLVPESPRWLFSHNKNKAGIKIAKHFFKKANMKPNESIWEKKLQTSVSARPRQYSSLDLFKPRRMRYVTMKVMIIWFSSGLLFYGLSLNVGSLYGNIFMNNALNAGVEILVSIFILAIFNRVERRILLSIAIFWSCLGCVVNGILNLNSRDQERSYVSLFGKVGAAASFHILYNFTVELYPTVVRSNGVGLGSMCARIGSICTPFVMFVAGFVPDFVYGAISLAAGVLAITLPETSDTNLCQTITEAEIMYLRSNSKNLPGPDEDLQL